MRAISVVETGVTMLHVLVILITFKLKCYGNKITNSSEKTFELIQSYFGVGYGFIMNIAV